VLEGLRGEESIAELCRREGIVQNLYYRWSKDCLEAGKKRLAGSPRPRLLRGRYHRQEDVSKELARLRKENEILRQEREILKKAAAFFAKEGSR
jgi:transposase